MITMEEIYKNIKKYHPDIYKNIVDRVSGYTFNNNLTLEQSADLEKLFMDFVYYKFINKEK